MVQPNNTNALAAYQHRQHQSTLTEEEPAARLGIIHEAHLVEAGASPKQPAATMSGNTTAKLAVLVDADNAQASRIGLLLAEVAKYGTAHVKRAYGDWTGFGLAGWKDQLLKQSIQPIQQFAYTQGKNSTDSAMIIDAMDLLYSGKLDGFCLVSSDSDFTRLASRIRESGLVVYGFGERKTPKPFVAACDKFIYVENLDAENSIFDKSLKPRAAAAAAAAADRVQNDIDLENELRLAVLANSDYDGWANLAKVGAYMSRKHPDFDVRSYHFSKLVEMISAMPYFELESRSPGQGKPLVVYARGRSPMSMAISN